LRQQVYEDSPFFAKLNADGKLNAQGGVSIQFPIRYQKLSQSEAVDPRSQITFSAKETRTGAVDTWAYYVGRTAIFWDEKASNGPDGRIVDLVKDKTAELKEDLSDKLCTDLFATSRATNCLTPLAVMVDSSTTYAGIAVADAASWAATEDGSETQLKLYGSTSLSYWVNACTLGKNAPTLHITTRNLKSKFESLLQPQVRYQDKKMLDLGFDNTLFMGAPVVGDVYCTAAYWYGLDMEQFEIAYNTSSGVSGLDVGDWIDLDAVGYVKTAGKIASWVGNVICRMRKTSFKLTALDYTK